MTYSKSKVLRRGLLLALLACVSPALAGDWHQWRGPEQNGVSREKNLPESWSSDGENVIWKNDCGGMTSPIVMRGKVYTFTRVGEIAVGSGDTATLDPTPETQEALTCIDAKTGAILWRQLENMTMTDVPFHRVGWSNPVGDPQTGRVYALGAQCMFVCVDGDNGKVIWERQMTEEFGLISTFGGRTPSPAVDEDIVYIAGVSFGWGDHAGSQHRIFAFDKTTGDLLWSAGTGGIAVDAPYNTPVISVINGQKLVVLAAGDGGVHAFQARTGKKVWSFKGSKRGTSASVVVDGDRVYASWDLDNYDSTKLGRVVCLDGANVVDGSPKEVWRVDGVEAGFPTATLHEGTLYVPTNLAQILAIDAKTGKVKYKRAFGTIGKASLVFADGKLYFPEANGRMWIIRPGESRFEVINKVEIEEKLGREYGVFGSIAVSDGRIFIVTANKMYCIGTKDSTVESDPIPAPVAEPKRSESGPVTHVQVVPFDAVLRPGGTQEFKVRTFDATGQPVAAQSQPVWSIGQLTMPPPRARPAQLTGATSAPAAPTPPPTTQPTMVGNLKGKIDAGIYTAEAAGFQGGAIVATIDNVKGHSRVRVLPPLPWKIDLSKTPPGKPPLTWIGAGTKFATRDVDGRAVLVKLNDIPLYARARTYLGASDMKDYVVRSDVRVTETAIEENGKVVKQVPDVGIINTRYVLELKGSKQTLGLHSWPAALPKDEFMPGLATHAAIPFTWEANKWYSLKIAVQQQGDKAVIRGKAWVAGTPEPSDWTISLEDPRPNHSGAPGLWGFSNGHEIFYENISVEASNP